LGDADTIILPGSESFDVRPRWSRRCVRRLRGAFGWRRSAPARSSSRTGLLDGLRATTHWAAATELASRYPLIDVDPDVLYVDNGQFLTSAGAAAGLDLCLHMIRRDHGSAVAATPPGCR